MKKITLMILWSSLALGALFLCTQCGYRLSGYGREIPEHIRTIYIPDFNNKTTRMEAGQFVTYAVRDEFIKRSDLKLVNSRSEADSILEGEITTFNTIPISYGHEASANLYRLTITLQVRFIDSKNNKIIFEGKDINFSSEYNVDEQDFFSQQSDSLKLISERFAESVVVTILENF